VETIEAYLDRKHEELKLLNDCLRRPFSLVGPKSVHEVIQLKFQLTASIRAEHELQDWTATETAWADAGQGTAGPFRFKYDYQRADMQVQGPSFYEFGGEFIEETAYTSSGMAAISALLLASARVLGQADVLVLSGTYDETIELIDGYARHLRKVILDGNLDNLASASHERQILLLDFCTPSSAFENTLRNSGRGLDLLIFDTSCFAAESRRIRRVLRWARQWSVPTVMVRSHNKLDSLGAEYGRLGSATFVGQAKDDPNAGKLKELLTETRNAIRLFGGAALPAHFPPFIGANTYRSLTKRRVAAILQNGRRTTRYFNSALKRRIKEIHFAHGLYVTLSSTPPLDETAARRAATKMGDDLGRAGFPIRHAGSFGFDFAATEWSHDISTDEYRVRIAVPDLPTELWDKLTKAAATWWMANGPGAGE
jgi:hypothetical protein